LEWALVYHIKGWGKFNRHYGDFCTGADNSLVPQALALIHFRGGAWNRARRAASMRRNRGHLTLRRWRKRVAWLALFALSH